MQVQINGHWLRRSGSSPDNIGEGDEDNANYHPDHRALGQSDSLLLPCDLALSLLLDGPVLSLSFPFFARHSAEIVPVSLPAEPSRPRSIVVSAETGGPCGSICASATWGALEFPRASP